MNGVYGTIKPAYLTESNIASDVEIFYSYRENRGVESTDDNAFKTLPSSILVPGKTEEGEIIPGVFSLQLPLENFGTKGIYTVYIRPREIEAMIMDIGVLAAYPDVRGIVLQTFDNDNAELNVNGALTGYRVEYFGFDNTRNSDYSIITSSNKCSTIVQNIVATNQKAVRYRFDDASNLLFCTVSPSTSPSFNANYLPYIGRANETIRLINTKFEPLLLEIEMVEHDEETISIMLEGDQIRNLDNGLITTYNFDHEIYRQHEYLTKKETTGKNLYDIKVERKSNIDTTQDFAEIMGTSNI